MFSILSCLCNQIQILQACYHKSCMDSFANPYQSFVKKEARANQKSQQNHESIALAETMIYIEETLQEDNTEVAPFIKLSTAQKYQSCLIALNAEFTTFNSTQLKEIILSLNKNLEATSGRKEAYISFKDDLAGALEYKREHSTDKNAAHLIRAANIIRKGMLEVTQDVNGTFAENCQSNSVPQSLFSMIYMLTGSA